MIKYGERGDKLYLIRYGKVKVLRPDDKGGRIEVAKLGRGSFVGERALIAGEALLRKAGKQRCESVPAAWVCTREEALLDWGFVAGMFTLVAEGCRGDGLSRHGAGCAGQKPVSLIAQRILANETWQKHRVCVVCSSSGLHRQSEPPVNLWQGLTRPCHLQANCAAFLQRSEGTTEESLMRPSAADACCLDAPCRILCRQDGQC